MDELTLALRQHSQAFRPTEDAFQRVVQRGNRHQRTRRIASAAVALGLFALVDLGILRGLAPSHSTLTPGGPSNVPSHGTPSDLVVPGSNGYSPFVGVRPTGRGPQIVHEPADRGQDHLTRRSGGSSSSGASSATTDEDSPRPMITQSLQAVPGGGRGGTSSLSQDGGHTKLSRAEEVQGGKKSGPRPCSARKTAAGRARCRARRHNRASGFVIGPQLHAVDPGTPSVLPGPPAETGTDPAGSVDPAAGGTSATETAPADNGSAGDQAEVTDSTASTDGAATSDGTSPSDSTSSSADGSTTSDATAP